MSNTRSQQCQNLVVLRDFGEFCHFGNVAHGDKYSVSVYVNQRLYVDVKDFFLVQRLILNLNESLSHFFLMESAKEVQQRKRSAVLTDLTLIFQLFGLTAKVLTGSKLENFLLLSRVISKTIRVETYHIFQ